MQRVPRSVQARQAPPKMAHRRVVEVMSAWLVDNFDPELAPWFRACKRVRADPRRSTRRGHRTGEREA